MSALLEVRNISRIFQMGSVSVTALNNVSLTIQAGEFVAIMGHSGSGKSTLLNILGFLDRPDTGTYRFMGREISDFTDDELSTLRSSTAGFIFQQFQLLPRLSVLENTELPLLYTAAPEKNRERIKNMLASVGLLPRLTHSPAELSGGEQQRAAIARSMVNDPLVLFADEPTGNLDTKNEADILSIITELNRTGKTIVMVTHEIDVARHAQRLITMRDGEIISDKNLKKTRYRERVSGERTPSFTASNLGPLDVLRYMKQAFNSILSHKLRSFLSMLGILIGVASVITMLAIGTGAKDAINERLSSLGSNVLTIRPGSVNMRGVAIEAGTVTRFTISDADLISELPEIKGTSPVVMDRAQVVYGNKNANTSIQGVNSGYAELRSYRPTAGHFFTEGDVRTRNKVALIGLTVVEELFQNRYPIGETIKINRINFRVIGILPERGSSMHMDRDDVIMVPVTTAMYRVMGKKYVDSIDVQVKNPDLIEKAKKSITDLIVKRFHVTGNPEESFFIMDMTEIRDAISSTSKTIAMLLGFVAVISLIVGGIGIMNIMLVTVKERTREIGLRKAIGARKKDILMQFLIESALLTSTGGATGILTGSLLSMVLARMAGWTVTITPFSVLLATFFSIMVGIFFGLWPAIHASRLKPVEALRYE